MSLLQWVGKREFLETREDYFETLYLQLTRETGDKTPLHTQLQLWADRDKSRNNPRWRIFAYAARKIQNGEATFANALRPFLPSEEFLLLQSGEFNGDLAGALRLVINTIGTKKKMVSDVSIVMMAGLSTLASVFATAVILGVVMWPEFLELAPLRFWDAWAVPLIQFHQFAAAHWLIVALSVTALFPIYFYLAPNWVAKGRQWADYIPPFSIYKGLQAVSFLSAMGALVESGAPVRHAFMQIRDIVPPYLRWHVARMLRRYDASGEDSIKAIRTGLFSQAMQDRIEDAARGQSFDEVLKQVGSKSTEIMQRVLKAQAVFLSGIILAINLASLSYTALVLVVATDNAQNKALAAEENGTRLLKR